MSLFTNFKQVMRALTLQAIEAIERYYHKTVVVSGRSDFHVHVLDFNYKDWAIEAAIDISGLLVETFRSV
jgi:hypothetical protein